MPYAKNESLPTCPHSTTSTSAQSRRAFLTMALVLALPIPARAAGIPIEIHRNPNCGCCDVYARYLEGEGFAVTLVDTFGAAAIHEKHGVPERLEGCHTALAGGYVFEGLIPAEYVKQVLHERRPVKGLSVPGMPVGAPGMPGPKRGPIHVYYLEDTSSPKVMATF
jgi:hypothetical protein